MIRKLSRKRIYSLIRAVVILAVCFAATLFVLQSELTRRSERAVMEALPVFSRQTARGLVGAVDSVAIRLNTAAQVVAALEGPTDGDTADLISAMASSEPFLHVGIMYPDGAVLREDGVVSTTIPRVETRPGLSETVPYELSRAYQLTEEGGIWALRVYVPIPGSENQLFGTVGVKDLFNRQAVVGFRSGYQGIFLFETDTGTILLDTLNEEAGSGGNIYDMDLLTEEQIGALRTGRDQQTVAEKQEKENVYLYTENSTIPGWSLCVVLREEVAALAAVRAGVPSAMAYGLLVLLYVVGAAVILLYYSVRERTVREEQAMFAAQAAEEANRAKSDFFTNVSHDIRTPLNAILGMAEVALREEDPGAKDNCLRDIRGSGWVLLDNINSVLDLSRLEAGELRLKKENYEILPTLHNVITILRMRAQEKKLTFHAEISEDIPSVLSGDAVGITQILTNLGGNAVKYTEKGSVTMSVDWEDGVLIIHMEDTGVGIHKEDLPEIFRSYGRLGQDGSRRIEGTGLGLHICRELTELMGGRIGVESTPGVGSDFWVRLPQDVVDATPCGPYQGAREIPLFQPTFSAPEAVMLVVDDQPANLRVCQGMLRPYGLEVCTARSGEEALEELTRSWPDLVLMDHMMPGMDGIEATERIRAMGKKNPYFAVVPIIAFTANAMKGMKEGFLAAGFSDYLSKPVDPAGLDELLKNWIPEDKQHPPTETGRPTRVEIPKDLAALERVDAAEGLKFCGTVSDYRKTLCLFRDQIPGKLRRIETAQREGKTEDYIVEVHGLKSAARWIGAQQLGAKTETLEMAAREGNEARVLEETPKLVAAYRALAEELANISEE